MWPALATQTARPLTRGGQRREGGGRGGGDFERDPGRRLADQPRQQDEVVRVGGEDRFPGQRPGEEDRARPPPRTSSARSRARGAGGGGRSRSPGRRRRRSRIRAPRSFLPPSGASGKRVSERPSESRLNLPPPVLIARTICVEFAVMRICLISDELGGGSAGPSAALAELLANEHEVTLLRTRRRRAGRGAAVDGLRQRAAPALGGGPGGDRGRLRRSGPRLPRGRATGTRRA